MADDAQLLRHYVEARSEEAFAGLVQRHLGLVYHAALRQLGTDRHLAEDVVLWVASQKAELRQRYGVLFQNLQLTAEQRAKFKDVQAARSARSMDIGAAVRARQELIKIYDAAVAKTSPPKP